MIINKRPNFILKVNFSDSERINMILLLFKCYYHKRPMGYIRFMEIQIEKIHLIDCIIRYLY